MQFFLDAREIQEKKNQLWNAARQGVPFAAKGALNRSAFLGRRAWKDEIEASMVLRNTWTTRNLKVVKAKGSKIARMESVIGSRLDYMLTQEEGGTERKKHKHGVAIPTSVASGEGRGAVPRRKRVRRPNRMGRIQLNRAAVRSLPRRQRMAASIRMALESGKRYVWLDISSEVRGVFRLMGSRRKPRLEMIWDVSRPGVRIPANPTLQRTLTKIETLLPRIHHEEILKQLKFHGVID